MLPARRNAPGGHYLTTTVEATAYVRSLTDAGLYVPRDQWATALDDAARSVVEEGVRYVLAGEITDEADLKRLLMMHLGVQPINLGRQFTQIKKRMQGGVASTQQKSPAQLAVLEAAFRANPYPDAKEKVALAAQTGLARKQVAQWFQNQRAKRGVSACNDAQYICEPPTAVQRKRARAHF